MQADWNIISNIAAPIVALFVGVWVNRKFEDRARLVAFYGHIAAFKVRQDDGTSSDAFTHSVVIRNEGRRPATDVRVSHDVFPPNVTVFPQVEYKTLTLPEGDTELVLPMLVSGEQVTISYLYFPPITYGQVNNRVRSREGFAKILNVLPTVPAPPWVRYCKGALMLAGVIAILYCAYELVLR